MAIQLLSGGIAPTPTPSNPAPWITQRDPQDYRCRNCQQIVISVGVPVGWFDVRGHCVGYRKANLGLYCSIECLRSGVEFWDGRFDPYESVEQAIARKAAKQAEYEARCANL